MRRENDGTILAADFEALSLFRIVFSIYLLVDFFLAVYPFFGDFYGDSGVLPIAALAAGGDRPGLAVALPFVRGLDLLPSRLFAVLYSAAILAFAVGYRTGWSNALVFAFNRYLYWRNPYLASGAETLAGLLLLWSLFLPMARYWSVDAALDPEPRDRPYPALPFVALRVQISSLYLFAGLFKAAGGPWRDGSALTWALSDNVFGATSPGLFLVHQAPALLLGINYLVIVFQIAFPFLVYCPWRNDLVRALALCGSVMMHTSFIFFLNVGAFPYVCLTMLLLLVPDSWIDRLLAQRRKRLAGVTIYYEPDCGFCHRVSLILREFLLSAGSSVVPASADPQALRLLRENSSWVVRGVDGKLYLKWRAMDHLLQQNLLLAPIAWFCELPFMRALMERIYDSIGTNRRRFAGMVRTLAPLRTARGPGRPMLAVCGFLMALALLSNIFGLVRLSFPALRRFDYLTAALQVRQSWEVFAPGPTHFRHDYRFVADLANGSMIDLIGYLPNPPLRSDANLRIVFASPRWAKYFTRFDEFTEAAWEAFGHYLCGQAQARVPSAASLRQVEITIVAEPIEGTPAPLKPVQRRAIACLPPSI